MDRNTTIGLILIGLLLTVFTVMNRPTDEDIQQAKEQQRKSQSATNTKPPATPNASNSSTVNTPKVDTGKKDSATNIAPTVAKVVRLENQNLRIDFNSKGAIVQGVFLKKQLV